MLKTIAGRIPRSVVWLVRELGPPRRPVTGQRWAVSRCYASSSHGRKNHNEKHRSSDRRNHERPGDKALTRSCKPEGTLALARVVPSKKTRDVLDQFMNNLKTIHEFLDKNYQPLPPIWESQTTNTPGDRQKLLEATEQVVQQIRDFVDQRGSIYLTHSHELSVLFQRVLKLYSQTCVPSIDPDAASIDALARVTAVLKLMESWNLDLQQKHCEYAMEIAARHGLWKDAADIFWRHIDPDHSGYNPFDVSVSKPVGLYVIARAARELGASPVQVTLEAVLRMSMVSPSDQEKYVLAAGTALGLAGEWEALVQMLSSTSNAAKLGQPLVAAVMRACLLCDRPQEALQVYDDFIVSELAIADEWQWSGGQDRIHPQCRSLAICALAQSHAPDSSRLAYDLYKEAKENGDGVSAEALCAVFQAFENEGRWQDSLLMLFNFLDDPVSELLQSNLLSETEDPYFFRPLISVMRSCNGAGQFGSAILALRVHQLSMRWSAEDSLTSQTSSLVGTLAEAIRAMPDGCELLAAIMVSLAGLGSYAEALELYSYADAVGAIDSDGDVHDLADFLRQEVATQVKRTALTPWAACYDDIHNFTGTIFALRSTNQQILNDTSLSVFLGSVLHSCNLTLQAGTGLQLLCWLKHPLSMRRTRTSVLSRPLETEGSIIITDRFLAAVVDAYVQTGNAGRAAELFESYARPDTQSISAWLLTSSAGIRALFLLRRQNEALAVFNEVVRERRSPELFSVTAEGLLEADRHAEINELYRLALSSSCLSEKLTVVAMQAIDATQNEGANRAMYKMVGEASRLTGLTSAVWLEERYWQLKRKLRRSNLNYLMWWRDPQTAHLDELDYALSMLERRSSLGLITEKAALSLIIKRAKSFSHSTIPPDKTGIAHIPRDSTGWIEILERVLDEALNTELVRDGAFLRDAALTSLALNCQHKLVPILENAMKYGALLNKDTIALLLGEEQTDRVSNLSPADMKMLAR